MRELPRRPKAADIAPLGEPMKRISSGRCPTIVGAVLTIALVIVLDKVSDALVNGENSSHAAGHLAYAIPALLLAFFLIWLCPPPKPTGLGRRSRQALIAGLLLLGAGGVTEAIGAFGYAGDESRIGILTTIHGSSWMLSFPGALILLTGVVLGVISLFQHRTTRALVFLVCASVVIFLIIR